LPSRKLARVYGSDFAAGSSILVLDVVGATSDKSARFQA
jgi:hypothetical protein